VDGRVQPSPYEGEAADDAFWEALYYGNPDRVTQKYLALAEAGATFASCWMMAGGMEHAKLLRSIRLMGEEVLPALRDAHPPATIPAEALKDLETSAPAQPARTPSD
jgi:hypothetical protein